MSIQVDGQRIRESVGKSLPRAKEILAIRRADAARGKLPVLKQIRLSEAWDLFLETRSDRKTIADYRRMGPWWAKALRDPFIARITRGQVEKVLVEMRRDGLAIATRNRHRAHLSGFLNWAKAEKWVTENVVSDIKILAENNKRERYLEADEEVRLIKYLDPRIADLVRLALLTGCRRGELLALRWPDLDLKKRTLRVRESKSGTGRTIPLSEEACSVVRGLDSRWAGGFVFPGYVSLWGRDLRQGRTRMGNKTVDAAWRLSCAEAGIEGLRFHDLRHTFASRLVQSGVPLYTVAKLLGHTDIKTTQRYAHLSDTEMRAAVEGLAK